MTSKDLYTVGELAKEMNVTVRTLQYYDREGLLHPSARSEGGRRLYTRKDMICLHQILSLKYLGFSLEEIKENLLSLDTPDQVAEALERQKAIIQEQISRLWSAASAVEVLQKEVMQMQSVDFSKYADIVTLLRQRNKEYWVLKLLNERLSTHIRDRFQKEPEFGHTLFDQYQTVLEYTVAFQEQGISPQSPEGRKLAQTWWGMIQKFTGGDMSMLPDLMQFNENKEGWDPEMAQKQEKADAFLGPALESYFQELGLDIDDTEEE